jgi:hypothetical protein
MERGRLWIAESLDYYQIACGSQQAEPGRECDCGLRRTPSVQDEPDGINSRCSLTGLNIPTTFTFRRTVASSLIFPGGQPGGGDTPLFERH